MKGFRNCLALLITLVMIVSLYAGCNEEQITVDETDTIEENIENAGQKMAEKESEANIVQTFLEKERDNDPILEWVDPYTDEELTEWEKEYFAEPEEDKTEEEYNEYHDYIRMRTEYYLAQSNYPVYYYYYSGRSEYRNGIVEENPTYDLSSVVASYAVPESFILNMLADACVEVRLKEAISVTVERTYQNEDERKKMEAMGEEPTYEAINLVFTVENCLWGDMKGDKEIVIYPRMMSEEFIDMLSDSTKTFVMFLWRHQYTGEYNQTGLPEYGTQVRAIFDYTDGKLKTYSNLEDVAAYNGMTAEKMIEEGERQAVKYKELLDYVRSLA